MAWIAQCARLWLSLCAVTAATFALLLCITVPPTILSTIGIPLFTVLLYESWRRLTTLLKENPE